MGLVHSSPRDVDFVKAENLESPLTGEEIHKLCCTQNDMQYPASEGSCIQTKGNVSLPVTRVLTYKQRNSFLGSHLTRALCSLSLSDAYACAKRTSIGLSLSSGVSLVLYIDASEDLVHQIVKRPLVATHFIEEHRCSLDENPSYDSKLPSVDAGFQGEFGKDIINQECSLTLTVIAGPAHGLVYSVNSTSTSNLPLTLGRVPPGDFVLKDSGVSGKHAMINWNSDKRKWELTDMGSLNGTLLNSKAINHPDTQSRNWGNPVELTSGDLITLGITSQIHVQINPLDECSIIPFGVGIASDPMAMRRGGKKLPMEDVCYFQWPLPGVNQFGVFGVCDGHGGADAAKSASKLLPEMVAKILSDSSKREMVLSHQDASDVLKEAFSQTEANLDNFYEGCTATLLLVWFDSRKNLFLQSANVGDSACVVNVDGKQVKMTGDHRITTYSERERIKETGQPLKDGDKRLCGLNLGRMLGDKFLKEQDPRFSSKPHISSVIRVHQTKDVFALLASDGFWDVVSVKKAVQLVFEARERCAGSDAKDVAEKVAVLLVDDARAMRTKDNTSVVYVDFDITIRTACKSES